MNELSIASITVAVGSITILLLVSIWKYVMDVLSKYLGKKLVDIIKEFLELPTNVNDIRLKIESIETKLGDNGIESVFDMLHGLSDTAQSLLQKNRLMLNMQGDLVWESDDHGRYVWASDGLIKLLKTTFQASFEGSNWIKIFHPDDRDFILEYWNQCIENGTAFILEKTRYVASDETVIPVRIEAYKLKNGYFVGVVEVLPDV